MTANELKAEIAAWVWNLPDKSPILSRLDAIRLGGEPQRSEEDWLSLKEVSQRVRKHAAWLWKLRVPQVCGERLAGRNSYKLSHVLEYLRSEACHARIAELNAQRRAHEQSKKREGI